MANNDSTPDQPTLDLPIPEELPRPRSRRQPKSPQTVTVENEGEALERRVGRLEFSEGAFVRLRAKVRINADAGRDILTDLDVVAVDVDARLRVTRSILECKSGAGQSGEPDRLLWLAGLRAFVGNPRAVLVRGSVSSRGRLIAQKLQIETMDDQRIQEREASVSWLPERFAHIGGVECGLAERRTDEILHGIAEIPSETVAFLREDFLLAPGRVLGVLSDMGAAVRSTPLPPPAGIVLGGHALVALIYAAITDSESLDFVSRPVLEDRLNRSVTVGSAESNTLEVLEQADAVMIHVVERIRQRYEEAGVSRDDLQIPRLRDIVSEAPTWIPRYVDFIEALRNNAQVGRELLQTAELACFEALVGGHAHEVQAFDHLFTVEHRQLLRLGVRLLEEICGGELASGLNGLGKIRFDRVPPAVPDRQSPPRRTE